MINGTLYLKLTVQRYFNECMCSIILESLVITLITFIDYYKYFISREEVFLTR